MAIRSAGKHSLILVLLVLGIADAHAGVYKWRDAQGNLHFSDTPPQGDAAGAPPGGVQEVAMSADFADVKVASKPPIANGRPNTGPTIGIDSFTLKLDGGKNVTIGRAFSGKNCTQSTDVQWNDGVLDLKGRVAEAAVAERFINFGYRFVGATKADADAVVLADLHINAELLALKFDACDTIVSGNLVGPGSRAYVKVRWTLLQKSSEEPLFRGTSAGAYNAWRAGGGTKDTVLKALAAAADNILGDPAFVDQLTTSSPTHAAPDTKLPSKIDVAYGDGAGSFRGRSESLLRSTLTVKTSRGHGSGVLIDASGFALTNAHVVGADTQVQIMLDDNFIDARVVRTDPHADVALLQFDPRGHAAASVARAEPRAGDLLYVVGTPLSIKLSHTVTQGILSAVREVDGARLYQTDAAVNPGNSGGPVFNEAGDLVALSVSGIVNAEGASMNVNYLIPIGRALTAVGAGMN